jgi:D-xylonolactonase
MQELTRGYGLIEGPLWLPEGLPAPDASAAADVDYPPGLLFSDVLGGGVFSLAADASVNSLFEHRRGIGGMAWHQAGGIVVSGRNVSFKAFSGAATKILLDRDEAKGYVGYNDLTTDSAGRIYVGSLGASPVFADGREAASGDLYLIDLDGSSRQVAQDIQLTNGLGFSPDGRTLYHSDSLRRTVHCYDVANNGDLGRKRVFVETDSGAPDGLAVAVDGSVWVALAGGSGVAGYSASGEFLQLLSIPEPMCTSVCFGGSQLEYLYIVSGSDGAPTDQAGAVYCCQAPVPGLMVPMARVALPDGK